MVARLEADQKAIAHILGTLDDKIELNQKMNQTLEEIAKAIFKSWFVDFDPVRAKAEGRPTGLPLKSVICFLMSWWIRRLERFRRDGISKVRFLFDLHMAKSNPRAKNRLDWKVPVYGLDGVKRFSYRTTMNLVCKFEGLPLCWSQRNCRFSAIGLINHFSPSKR